MTKEEWLSKAKDSKEDLSSLILNYHPASKERTRKSNLPITAPAPESACENVRESVRAEYREILVTPTQEFDAAIESDDIDAINSLLSAAWFGVPESTSCWNIPGFAIAVDLMDDLPEEMYDAESL